MAYLAANGALASNSFEINTYEDQSCHCYYLAKKLPTFVFQENMPTVKQRNSILNG